MNQDTLTAGEAAARAGVSRKAMRVYESKGLVAEPQRSSNGYRLFTADDVAALAFIRQARTLGLHLDDIGKILSLHRNGTAPCQSVRTMLDQRISEIDTALADLQALRVTLSQAREDAPRTSEPKTVCALVEQVASPDRPDPEI